MASTPPLLATLNTSLVALLSPAACTCTCDGIHVLIGAINRRNVCCGMGENLMDKSLNGGEPFITTATCIMPPPIS